MTRAIPLAVRLENGQVAWPEAARWAADLEEELLSFPAGRHDDQVDALAYLVAEVAQGRVSTWTARRTVSAAGLTPTPPMPPAATEVPAEEILRGRSMVAGIPEEMPAALLRSGSLRAQREELARSGVSGRAGDRSRRRWGA